MIKVKILTHTPEPEKVVAMAARQTRLAGEVTGEMDEERIPKLIGTLLRMKHLSPFEHASFTFLISGISRTCSHQLIRHRLASYSQQSQRAVKVTRNSFVTPPSIKRDRKALSVFERVIDEAMKGYYELISIGVPLEDARFIIPQAVETKIVVTMNARELLHFFGLRLCKRAQWEIRKLAELILGEVKKIAPNIFGRAGPRCWDYNFCPEGDDKCFSETIHGKIQA